MKKMAIFVVACCLALAIGCGNEAKDNDDVESVESSGNNYEEIIVPEPDDGEEPDDTVPIGLSEELESRIFQDCVAIMGSTVNDVEYFGTYNGWVVVRVWMPILAVQHWVTIGGFRFNTNPPIIAWKNGEIHSLKDAYDLGLLTPDDIRRIAEVYEGRIK